MQSEVVSSHSPSPYILSTSMPKSGCIQTAMILQAQGCLSAMDGDGMVTSQIKALQHSGIERRTTITKNGGIPDIHC